MAPSRHPPTSQLFVDALYVAMFAATAASIFYAPPILGTPFRELALGLWAAEAAFFLFGRWRLTVLNKPCKEQPKTDQLESVWGRFLELSQVFGIEEFLRGWFLGADPEDIRRGNLEEFIAYAFFNQHMADLCPRDQARVNGFLDDVLATWGLTVEPGHNPEVTYMSWMWEDLRVYHKPLSLYVATEAAGWLAAGLLRAMGFGSGFKGRFKYWLRLPEELEEEEEGWGSEGEEGGRLLPDGTLSPHQGQGALSQHGQHGQHGHHHHQRSAAGVAVHSAAEQALDAAVTVAGMATAAVAAQHPHDSLNAFRDLLMLDGPSRVAVLLGQRAAPAVAAAAAAAPPPPHRPVPRRPRTPRTPMAAAAAAASSPALAADGPASGTRSRRRSSLGAAAAAAGKPQPTSPDAAKTAAFPAPLLQRRSRRTQPQPQLRQQQAGAARGVPIVFLHGVGFGTLPYLHFVRDCCKACPSSPVLMIEVRHVALRLCWDAAPVDEVAGTVVALLRERGYSHACIVGHSYGTFVASRICQLHREVVHSACLLDPVSMMTCYPQLLYNFIYKPPTFDNFSSPLGVVDMARYLCSRDLTIAEAFCRKFSWAELQLWPDDLPTRAVVVLSGGDDLVPSELVRAQLALKGHPAKVMFHPDIGHGGILISPAWMAEVVASIRDLVLSP